MFINNVYFSTSTRFLHKFSSTPPEEDGRILVVDLLFGLDGQLRELGLEVVQGPDVLDHVVHRPSTQLTMPWLGVEIYPFWFMSRIRLL